MLLNGHTGLLSDLYDKPLYEKKTLRCDFIEVRFSITPLSLYN